MVARKPASRASKPDTKNEQEELMAEAESSADDFIDLSNVKAEHGGAVAAGHYLCEIESVTKGVTGANAKTPGQLKVAIQWKILEGPDGQPSNSKIFKHLTLVGDQAGRSRGWIEDLGFDLSQEFNPSDMVGIVAELDVSIQKSNPGFNNIDKVEVVDGDDSAV